MASGFPGRDLRGGFGFGAGSAIHVPPYPNRSEPAGGGGGAAVAAAAAAVAGGLLKRSLSEMERQQQVRLQEALLFRSVKQRTLLPSSISTVSSVDLSLPSTSASVSSFSPGLSTLTASYSSAPSSSLSASSLSSGLGGYVRRQHQHPNPLGFSFSTASMAPSCLTESENKSTRCRTGFLRSWRGGS